MISSAESLDLRVRSLVILIVPTYFIRGLSMGEVPRDSHWQAMSSRFTNSVLLLVQG